MDGKPLNDNLLVRRVKDGDEAAFFELVERYRARAFAIAYRFTHNTEDAKDLSQEAFLKMYRSIAAFREGSTFYTWFYRIVTNTCIDFVRKRSPVTAFSQIFRRKTVENERMADIGDGMMADRKAVVPESAYLQKELDSKMKQAIDALPAQQKTVFILRNYEGFRIKEIARIMNCAEGTVKSHLARALKSLQKKLSPYLSANYQRGHANG